MEERVREKIRTVKTSVEKVESNLPNEFEEFHSMGLEKDGIYKNVETAIQASYDICAILVKERNLSVPGDESSIPSIVAEAGIISEETSEKLKDMKGFRNALAHRYGSIDDEIAYRNIKAGLQDFRVFLDEIEEDLESEED